MGVDRISPYFIRYGGDNLYICIFQFFNFCWRYSVLPQELKDSNISPIYKKSGALNSAANFKPISITSVIIRLYERLILPRLLSLLSPTAINRFQAGFRSKYSCCDHLFYLSHARFLPLPVTYLLLFWI